MAGASALALAAAAPAAEAATAYVTHDGAERVLHYEAVPGELNRVAIAKRAGNEYELVEELYGWTTLTIVPGAGCTARAGNAATLVRHLRLRR